MRFFYNLPRFLDDFDRGVLYANNICEELKKNSCLVLAKNLFLERKALAKEILYIEGDVDEKEDVESER